MFVAFDAFKLLDAGSTEDEGPDGVKTIRLLPRCASPQEVFERADLYGVQPFFMRVADVDDETRKIREEWPRVLLAGPTEDAVRRALADIFGRQWAYGGRCDDGSDDPNEYPPRFRVVEVPDDRTFGAKWVGCGGAPRAVLEA